MLTGSIELSLCGVLSCCVCLLVSFYVDVVISLLSTFFSSLVLTFFFIWGLEEWLGDSDAYVLIGCGVCHLKLEISRATCLLESMMMMTMDASVFYMQL